MTAHKHRICNIITGISSPGFESSVPATHRFEGPSRTRSKIGFSLLELIVVLVVLGVLAGLVAPMLARQSGVGLERRTTDTLAAVFLADRLDAMRTGRTLVVTITPGAAGLRIETIAAAEGYSGEPDSAASTRVRTITRPGVAPIDDTDRASPEFSVVINPRGRASVERIRLRSIREPGRLWEITFDPVGGVPTARRHTEGSQS